MYGIAFYENGRERSLVPLPEDTTAEQATIGADIIQMLYDSDPDEVDTQVIAKEIL